MDISGYRAGFSSQEGKHCVTELECLLPAAALWYGAC